MAVAEGPEKKYRIVRIESGEQNKPVTKAYFLMLKGSWAAVK
jgi:hypothetical protein